MTENKGHAFGSVRLHHAVTKEIILVPQPSKDPNDPLNWSAPFRYYIALITCMSVFLTQFLAAGPSAAMIDIIDDVFGVTPMMPQFQHALGRASYFFTTFAFSQGVSTLIYMPLIIKFGRRPVYLISFFCYLCFAIWSANAHSYDGLLASRILLGFASGSADCLAPLTIADVTYLHERGFIMSCYSACLSSGVACGVLITGFIAESHSWRIVNYIVAGATGALLLAVFFSMPETAYRRKAVQESGPASNEQLNGEEGVTGIDEKTQTKASRVDFEHAEIPGEESMPKRKSYGGRLRVFNSPMTEESLIKMFIRPFPFLLVPDVLWATLVMSVAIGTFIALANNYASTYAMIYGFNTGQVGLVFLAVVIGAMISIWGGGWLSDFVADWMTKRNGGIREPEMRLPTILLSMILMPTGCMLYAVGTAHRLHWIVPTIGISFVGFVITQSANIVLVYVVDGFRPIAGEAVVVLLSFKSAFAFLLSFYVNPWVAKSGIMTVMGVLSAINFGVILFWIPLMIWGRRIRHTVVKMKLFRSIDWAQDREVGE